MVKDNLENESNVRKRRKTTPETTKNEEDVYKKVVAFEETEAKLRSLDKDAELYCNTCENIRKILAEIAQLKKVNSEDALKEIMEKRVQVNLHFVLLKKLNRLEKIRTKVSRDALHKEKQRVDSTQLQLHNLLYELEHLKKEITKCLQFKSKDEEIDLVPVDKFYIDAPVSISRPDVTKNDEHLLKLARLEWELKQRKQLSELCQKLQSDKTKAATQIITKQERLDGLAPHLNHILEVTRPVQDLLGLPQDKVRQQHALALLLPDPLFLLYSNANGYFQVNDKNTTISIIGDEEEARHLKTVMSDVSSDSESDQEMDNAEENNEREDKRHHRKSDRSSRQTEKRNRLLAVHPLSLKISIRVAKRRGDPASSQNGEPVLNVTFFCLPQLNIVTVKCETDMNAPIGGVCAGDVVSNDNILSELFPSDSGEDSPNMANHYQLHQIDLGPFSSLVGRLGRPYNWAQRVCGFDFLLSESKASEKLTPRIEVCRSNIDAIMKAVKKRFTARISLCQQIQTLESGLIPVIPSSIKIPAIIPSDVKGSIQHWKSITWSEFKLNLGAQEIIESEYVTSNDLLYNCTITRAQAKLVAFVAIKNDFPNQFPIFSVNIQWNGEYHARNSDAIRDMERIINTDWGNSPSGSWTYWILSAQVRRLVACFDIFLETTGPKEFQQEKIFFKPVRGRNRSRPYRYLQVGGGVFTQY